MLLPALCLHAVMSARIFLAYDAALCLLRAVAQVGGIASEERDVAHHPAGNHQTELDGAGRFDAALRSSQSNWFRTWQPRELTKVVRERRY